MFLRNAGINLVLLFTIVTASNIKYFLQGKKQNKYQKLCGLRTNRMIDNLVVGIVTSLRARQSGDRLSEEKRDFSSDRPEML